MQITTLIGRHTRTPEALLHFLEAPGAGRGVSDLTELSRNMEAILDISERLLVLDPEGGGVSWANVAHVLGSLAGRIIDKLERLHEELAALKSAGREALAIPEARLIQERLRAGGTFARKGIRCFGEIAVKTFNGSRITAFGPSARRPVNFASGEVNNYDA